MLATFKRVALDEYNLQILQSQQHKKKHKITLKLQQLCHHQGKLHVPFSDQKQHSVKDEKVSR